MATICVYIWSRESSGRPISAVILIGHLSSIISDLLFLGKNRIPLLIETAADYGTTLSNRAITSVWKIWERVKL